MSLFSVSCVFGRYSASATSLGRDGRGPTQILASDALRGNAAAATAAAEAAFGLGADADALRSLLKIAREQCYEAVDVLEIELAGYQVLGGMLEWFVPAVLRAPLERTPYERRAQTLLSRIGTLDGATDYEKILRVTDHVSGMTDRHALSTYHKLSGISLPSRGPAPRRA